MQSQDNETNARQETADSAGAHPAGESASRPVPAVAALRRRAIFVSLGMLAFLLVIGLADALGGFLPHTTAPFANGRAQSAGGLQVALQFTPNPPTFSNTPATLAQITVQGRDGQMIDGARVQLGLTMVTMDMGTNATPAQGLGQGRYQARIAFVMPGAWQVRVTVTPPGSPSVSATFAVDVAN